jgi:hypothetical protein
MPAVLYRYDATCKGVIRWYHYLIKTERLTNIDVTEPCFTFAVWTAGWPTAWSLRVQRRKEINITVVATLRFNAADTTCRHETRCEPVLSQAVINTLSQPVSITSVTSPPSPCIPRLLFQKCFVAIIFCEFITTTWPYNNNNTNMKSATIDHCENVRLLACFTLFCISCL